VFIDAPGGHYWRDWLDYVRSHLGDRGLINPEDLGLFRVTDSVERAIQEILGFYRNYHSSRYVGDKLVIRVRQAPDAPLLEELNDEFGDIITSGRIEASSPLSAEEGEAGDLPRVVLHFNRRNVARVRALIDRLNGAVLQPPPSSDASRREIIATPLTPEEERAEEEDEREF
jgi:hypothetical protein